MDDQEKQQLRKAITAIKAGDKKTGRKLLADLLGDNPDNEIAWLWMSTTVRDLEKKRYCLKQVLRIDPTNEAALKRLQKLKTKKPQQPTLPTTSSSSKKKSASKNKTASPSQDKPTRSKRLRNLAIFAIVIIGMCCCLPLALQNSSTPASESESESVNDVTLPPTYTPLSSGPIATFTPPKRPSSDSNLEQFLAQSFNATDVLVMRFSDSRSGVPYPEGRTGYEAEIYLSSADLGSREDFLTQVHATLHHIYFNSPLLHPAWVSLRIRLDNEWQCTFTVSLGYQAAATYLDEDFYSDVDGWWSRINAVTESIQMEDVEQVYGNDFGPECSVIRVRP